jgi:small subunit ribosomal protein S1
VTDFGVFLELEEGIEGLIHISELRREKVKSASEVCKDGDELEALVIHADSKERKIGLSVKALLKADEEEDIQGYLANQRSLSPTIGTILRDELLKKAKESQMETEQGEVEPSSEEQTADPVSEDAVPDQEEVAAEPEATATEEESTPGAEETLTAEVSEPIALEEPEEKPTLANEVAAAEEEIPPAEDLSSPDEEEAPAVEEGMSVQDEDLEDLDKEKVSE